MEYVDIFANIYIEYKRDGNIIYQIITIRPNRPGNIRYFIHPRYKIGRATEDFLQKIYIGDGENIFFLSEDVIRNIFTIKYRIDDDTYYINFKNKQYLIEGKKPKMDGCSHCQHLRNVRQGKDYCELYKKFLDKWKKSCVNFLEKD